MLSPTLIRTHELTLDIGEMPILVRTDSADFAKMLAERYGEFVAADAPQAAVELDIELVEPGQENPGYGIRDTGYGNRDSDLGLRTSDVGLAVPANDLSVRFQSGRWFIERKGYHAEWDPETNRGWVRQTANPYTIDSVLRILHSLILAREGGFLVHAASAVRNGRAFVFAGLSGTGKTTISRLAPPDVAVLTDEISYLRPVGQVTGNREQVKAGSRSQESGVRGDGSADSQITDSKFKIQDHRTEIANGESQIVNLQSPIPNPQPLIPDPGPPIAAFQAFGTPFAGEMARIGKKCRAPLATLFLLKQGPENRIEPLSENQAARELLRHVLFFAHDQGLVGKVFQTVCDFVTRVPVRRLVFKKDAGVWELIK